MAPFSFTVTVAQDTEEFAGGPYTNVAFTFGPDSYWSFLCSRISGDVLEADCANVPPYARLEPSYEMAAQAIARAANRYFIT